MSFIDEVWLDNQTLEAFLASEDFATGVIQSTKAGFSGSCYKVEFFPDGSWRVLWANMIGNRYVSPGRILSIPQLSDEDYAAFSEMAGSDELAALVAVLRGTDELEACAARMRKDR